MRTFITFNADFADDAVYGSTIDIVVPAGKNVANAVAQQLRLLGHTCSDAEQHEFYGWSIDVNQDGRQYWLLVQGGGNPWLLTCHSKRSLFQRMFGRVDRIGFKSFLMAVNTALHADARFTLIRWLSREDYEANRDDAASDAP